MLATIDTTGEPAAHANSHTGPSQQQRQGIMLHRFILILMKIADVTIGYKDHSSLSTRERFCMHVAAGTAREAERSFPAEETPDKPVLKSVLHPSKIGTSYFTSSTP